MALLKTVSSEIWCLLTFRNILLPLNLCWALWQSMFDACLFPHRTRRNRYLFLTFGLIWWVRSDKESTSWLNQFPPLTTQMSSVSMHFPVFSSSGGMMGTCLGIMRISVTLVRFILLRLHCGSQIYLLKRCKFECAYSYPHTYRLGHNSNIRPLVRNRTNTFRCSNTFCLFTICKIVF